MINNSLSPPPPHLEIYVSSFSAYGPIHLSKYECSYPSHQFSKLISSAFTVKDGHEIHDSSSGRPPPIKGRGRSATWRLIAKAMATHRWKGRRRGGGGTLLSLICDVMPPNKAFLQSVPCHLHFSESALRFSLLLFACHRAPLHCIAFRSISSRILMTRPVCNVIASLKTTSRVLELERKSVTYTNHMDVVN